MGGGRHRLLSRDSAYVGATGLDALHRREVGFSIRIAREWLKNEWPASSCAIPACPHVL